MVDFDRIRELATLKAEALARAAELDHELRQLIRDATQGDVPRDRVRNLAGASGLSVPRIYQIRDRL